MGSVTILLVSSPLATGPTTQLFRKFVSKQKTYGAISQGSDYPTVLAILYLVRFLLNFGIPIA